MTKEEAIKKLGEADGEVKRLTSLDQSRRTDFARVFNWVKPRLGYGGEQEFLTPSWPEIFSQVGKLLAEKGFSDLKEENLRLNEIIGQMDNKIRELTK